MSLVNKGCLIITTIALPSAGIFMKELFQISPLRKSYKKILNFCTIKRALTGVQRAKTVVIRGFGTHLRAKTAESMV